MTLTFGSLLEKRKLEVLEGIKRVQAILTKEQAILAELNEMLESLPPNLYASEISAHELALIKPDKAIGPRGLIKKAVLNVLADNPSGLDALAILDKINAKSAKPYERTSLSPQLSRLKDDGYIIREGKIWKLKKIEPLDATPGKDSSKGSDNNSAKDREAGSGGGA